MMPFFHFNQNNSGGHFDFNAGSGITHHVVIEAENFEAANEKLEAIGGYFDGCDSERDCECCGDRWYRTGESDADEAPSVYGSPVAETKKAWMCDPGQHEAVVHYMDGRIEWFG